MRVVQRSPREQGRILCLPHSRRSLVAPQVPSGSSSSTACGSCAAAAAPALSRGSQTLSPGCPSSCSCREGLRGPKRRVPAPGQSPSIHPVAAGQEGICAPGPLSWLQPPSTGGSLAHGMGFNTVGISCFGVLRCGHQLESCGQTCPPSPALCGCSSSWAWPGGGQCFWRRLNAVPLTEVGGPAGKAVAAPTTGSPQGVLRHPLLLWDPGTPMPSFPSPGSPTEAGTFGLLIPHLPVISQCIFPTR